MINKNEIADQLIGELSAAVRDGEIGLRAVMDGRVGVFDRGGDLRVEIASAPGVVRGGDFGLAFYMPTPGHDLFFHGVQPSDFRAWSFEKELVGAVEKDLIDPPDFSDLDVFYGDFDEQVIWALRAWVLEGGGSAAFRAEILQELPSLAGDVVRALQEWRDAREMKVGMYPVK